MTTVAVEELMLLSKLKSSHQDAKWQVWQLKKQVLNQKEYKTKLLTLLSDPKLAFWLEFVIF